METMLKYYYRIKRAAKFWLLFIINVSLLLLLSSNLKSQDLPSVEFSVDLGYSYQPQKILNDYSQLFTKSNDLSNYINFTPGFSIARIGLKDVHKMRLSSGEWQHFVTYEHIHGEAGAALSKTYWFASYQYGKRWKIFNSNRVASQVTIGPILALRQPSPLDGILPFFDFDNNGRNILVETQDVTPPDASLGVTLESSLNILIFKPVSLQIGMNGFYWPKTIYGDRNYKIMIDYVEKPDITIRSYKHIWSFTAGLSFEF